MDENASLNDKIERKYADALRALANTNSQIRNDMVYRAALSGLFAETVGGLAKPWNAEALAGAPEAPQEGPEAAPSQDHEQPAPQALAGGQEEAQENLPQVVDNY